MKDFGEKSNDNWKKNGSKILVRKLQKKEKWRYCGCGGAGNEDGVAKNGEMSRVGRYIASRIEVLISGKIVEGQSLNIDGFVIK